MNACIHRGWRWRRCRLLGAAALTAVVWLWGQPPALATNPVRPVEIVTPEEVAARDQIMPDTVEIRVREGEVRNLQAQLLLFRNGEQLLEQRLDPSFERAQPSDEVDESDGPVSVATIPAVPQAFLERVEPGIYAHKVQVTAEIQEGVPPLVVSEWVRWRTDGKQVEFGAHRAGRGGDRVGRSADAGPARRRDQARDAGRAAARPVRHPGRQRRCCAGASGEARKSGAAALPRRARRRLGDIS